MSRHARLKPITLTIDADLRDAIEEITPHATLAWQDVAIAYLRGSVAEFWQNASAGSGLSLDRYRERVRAFVREGDTLINACHKAREGG